METLGTVLVHEPDPEVRRKIQAVLRREKVVFTSEKTTVTDDPALEPPVALVVDVDRTDASGFEIVLRLKCLHNIPVVVITENPPFTGKGPHLSEALRPQDVGVLRERLAAVLEEQSVLRAFQHEFAAARAAMSKRSTHDSTEVEDAALASVGFPVDAALNPKPIARRAAHFERLRRTSLTTEEAAKRLHVNTSRIRQRLTAKPPQLYGIRQGSEWRLPAFQFGEDGLVPSIEAVIAKLPSDLDPVAVELWFRSPHVDLVHGGERLSPLDWLSQGLAVQPLAELAEHL